MNINLKFKNEWLMEYKQRTKNQNLVPAWIYFEHDNECYPDDDWIDNPAILLGWWFTSFVDLMQGGQGQGFDFMEGPYSFNATIENNFVVLKSEDNKVSWKVDKKEFVDELIRAGNEVARNFYKFGLTELSQHLNEHVKKLKAEREKL
jgi:hypothetical protein